MTINRVMALIFQPEGEPKEINRGNGINQLINFITLLIQGLSRLINGWGARPGPSAINSPSKAIK